MRIERNIESYCTAETERENSQDRIVLHLWEQFQNIHLFEWNEPFTTHFLMLPEEGTDDSSVILLFRDT